MLSKFLKHLSKQQKIDILSVFIACIIITFITIAALSTNNIYYDTTGQQLLARQWLDGHFGGSSVSATSYIWKIFLFYMPSELLGLNPKISLYVLTILFNILTVIGLFAVIKAILKHFKVNHDSRLGLSMIWLSVMSVSIFWVGFANSRNLELVMGLTVLYFGLSLYKNKKASPKHIIMLSCLAGVVYFCDPMQLWITTTVLVGYVLIDNLPLLSRPPHPAKKALFKVIISVGGGIVIYQILILLAKNILKVHFFWMGDYLFTAIGAALANFPQVAAKTIDNIAYIFSGGIGTHPENILFAIIITIGAIVLLFHKKHSRDLRIFLPLFLLTTIIVPTLSGFNLFIGNSTPRFMIMLVPAIIILWSSVCLPNPKTIICIIIIWLVLELPTSINFMTNTNGQFSNETAMFEYREQLESSNYAYAWSSMTIASVASYLNPDGKPIIPLACTTQTDKPQIVISQMFYDIDATKSIIDQYSNKNDEVMIILEADYLLTQTSPSTHCTIDAFIRTFGNPLRAEQSAFNNKLLFYDEKQFNDTILGLPVMEQF